MGTLNVSVRSFCRAGIECNNFRAFRYTGASQVSYRKDTTTTGGIKRLAPPHSWAIVDRNTGWAKAWVHLTRIDVRSGHRRSIVRHDEFMEVMHTLREAGKEVFTSRLSILVKVCCSSHQEPALVHRSLYGNRLGGSCATMVISGMQSVIKSFWKAFFLCHVSGEI